MGRRSCRWGARSDAARSREEAGGVALAWTPRCRDHALVASVRMYSAASRRSSIEAPVPRRAARAGRRGRSRSAVEVLSARADLDAVGVLHDGLTSRRSVSSVTIGRPVSARASARIFRPGGRVPGRRTGWSAAGTRRAQEVGARVEAGAGGGQRLVGGLDRARAEDQPEGGVGPPKSTPRHPPHGPGRHGDACGRACRARRPGRRDRRRDRRRARGW